MNSSEISRVQTYLRKLLGSERVQIVAPPRKGATIEIAVGDEVVGTINRDDDEGEVSYSINIIVLEEDLPAEKTASPGPAGKTPGTPRR